MNLLPTAVARMREWIDILKESKGWRRKGVKSQTLAKSVPCFASNLLAVV